LQPGAPIKVLKRAGLATKVQFHDASTGMKAEGWIPGAAIGTLLLSDASLGDDSDFDSADASIFPNASLRATPNGKAITPADRGLFPQNVQVLDRNDSHALVILRERLWSAVGWVSLSEMLDSPEYQSIQRMRKNERVIEILPGTPLLTAPRGAPFGNATKETEMFVEGEQNGHCKISVPTRAGVFEAWVAGASKAD
jgi:hypothetical protein